MRKIAITGAGGFVGSKLTEQLLKDHDDIHLTLLDMKLPSNLGDCEARVTKIEGSLQSAQVVEEFFQDGVDILYHLAAVPGGAAEANPELSKQVNLDGTLDLFSRASQCNNNVIITYASTVAVIGADMPDVVNDDTPLQPTMTYGSHKAMIELALSDMHRRKLCTGISFRLPGIVARPPAPSGLKSAFMSNLFHSLKDKQAFVSPVSEKATFWLMSVNKCAENFSRIASDASFPMPPSRAFTFPAIYCSMKDLVSEICKQTSADPELVSYEVDEELEKGFGSVPCLETPAAEAAGFTRDADLSVLVSEVLRQIQ